MNGSTSNRSLVELSLGELIHIKDVLLSVLDRSPLDDIHEEIEESLEIIDSVMYFYYNGINEDL